MINYKLNKSNLTKTKDFLIFTLGNEEYAIDVQKVQEICLFGEITHIANMPSHIKGIKKLADKMALIIDLRQLFNVENSQNNERTIIIILNLENHLFGLIVSDVKEVLSIPEDQFSFEENFQSLVSSHYIQKIARINERLFFIVDINNLYSQEILHLTAKVPA